MSARCRRRCFPACGSVSWWRRRSWSPRPGRLRRLMVRHAPNNNQRTAALFLSLGHHDTLIRRLHRAYRTRWEIMGEALQQLHAGCQPAFRASAAPAFWVKGPATARQRRAWHGRRRQGHPDRTRAASISASPTRRAIIPPGILVDRRKEDRARHQAAGGNDRRGSVDSHAHWPFPHRRLTALLGARQPSLLSLLLAVSALPRRRMRS